MGKVDRTPTINLGKNTALKLVEPFYAAGLNLICDNFFADYELIQKLNTEKMSLVGTLRRHKWFMLTEIHDSKQTEKEHPKFGFRKDGMLAGAKKNVIIMSSIILTQPNEWYKKKKNKKKKKKTRVAKKCGVGTMDLMAHTVSKK